MVDNAFFDEMREQSRVKATIVSKYFDAWANVMIANIKRYPDRFNGRLGYIDLFCGPGQYADGSKSTPLLILEKAIDSEELRQRLGVIFNDKDASNCSSLRKAIGNLNGIDTLRYPPKICGDEITDDIVKVFEKWQSLPTLFFVDPWGYKGLSLRLVATLIKGWGCDCIVFFNYNRVRMHLSNPSACANMDALFGKAAADKLRTRLGSLKPHAQELAVIEEMCQALLKAGGSYVLPFRFKNEDGTRTSHHLVFVSKHVLGYEIMKGIMARESSANLDGVASFEYNPASPEQPLLYKLFCPIEELGSSLRLCFSGRTLSVSEIYKQHNVGRPYIKSNYKEALLKLEADGVVRTNPPATSRRPKGTIADRVMVSFPPDGV